MLPQVEDILEAREWDQYKDMIDELRGHVGDPALRSPGSRAFARVLELHTAVSRLAKIKVVACYCVRHSCTTQHVYVSKQHRLADIQNLEGSSTTHHGGIAAGVLARSVHKQAGSMARNVI